MSQIAAEWSFGELDVLMSTTMGLVGNENPSCRHLVCIGYLYDSLQLVQFLGRLRNSMQKEFGKVMFAVPNTFSGKRIMDDNLRYTRLLHEGFVSDQDHINFNSVLTSSGVRNWLMDTFTAEKGCAMNLLSVAFGRHTTDNCGAYLFCRTIPLIALKMRAKK